MDASFPSWARKGVAVLFLLLLAAACLLNAEIFLRPMGAFLSGTQSFGKTAAQITDRYPEEMEGKYAFIGLNGLAARVTGRRVYHGVSLLKGNTLSHDVQPPRDMEPFIEGIGLAASRAKEQGSTFLYVQAPYKVATDGSNRIPGWENSANGNVDALLAGLSAQGVNTLDLRKHLSATGSQVLRYFDRTDHHWNADGSFSGFESIMSECRKLLGPNLDTQYAVPALWEKMTQKGISLGSHGRRVGALFVGVDDFTWMVPKFATQMSYAVPAKKVYSRGNFQEANLNAQFVETGDYFHSIPYNLYCGGNQGWAIHRNESAPNRMRVLLVKDSFAVPVECFLSTEFTEVYAMDLRNDPGCTVLEAISWQKPDLVVFMVGATIFGDQTYATVGSPDSATLISPGSAWGPVAEQPAYTLEAAESSYHFATLKAELQPGHTYRLRIDRMLSLSGDAGCVSVRLFDSTKDKTARSMIYDLAFADAFGPEDWIFTVPEEDHDYQLQFFSGLYGQTAGQGARYEGIRLEELIQPEST